MARSNTPAKRCRAQKKGQTATQKAKREKQANMATITRMERTLVKLETKVNFYANEMENLKGWIHILSANIKSMKRAVGLV